MIFAGYVAFYYICTHNGKQRFPGSKGRNGGMVDTKDLKSFGLCGLCGFESHFLYLIRGS